MLGSEIVSILENRGCTSKIFRGIYSSNNLPKHIEYPSAYIVNTDESYNPGEHWVAFYFKSEKSLPEYFDSYGLPPMKLSFYKFLSKDKFRFSTKVLQGPFSTTCGDYAIFFVIHRVQGFNMNRILTKFTTNTSNNDSYVKEFIHKLTTKKIKCKKKSKRNCMRQTCTSQYVSGIQSI